MVAELLNKRAPQEINLDGVELAPVRDMSQRPGAKTTEFWLVIVVLVASFAHPLLTGSDNQILLIAGTVMVAVYKVGRFMLKMRSAGSLEKVDMLKGELQDAYSQIEVLLEDIRNQKDQAETDDQPIFPVTPEFLKDKQ